MEEIYLAEGVRQRLIIAGINELEKHGAKDFSLRRVALSAQVSCAAPYRHFRDKDEFIVEIIKYISSKWELMCHQIENVFHDDACRLVIELAVANLRFWLSNPNFHSVLTVVSPGGMGYGGFSRFDMPLVCAIEKYASAAGLSAEEVEMKKYTVRALIYGSLMLTGREDGRDSVTELLRKKLIKEFP
jgi:AcrR family transcriptional regulator